MTPSMNHGNLWEHDGHALKSIARMHYLKDGLHVLEITCTDCNMVVCEIPNCEHDEVVQDGESVSKSYDGKFIRTPAYVCIECNAPVNVPTIKTKK